MQHPSDYHTKLYNIGHSTTVCSLTSMKVSSRGSLALFLGVLGPPPTVAPEVVGTPGLQLNPCPTAALPVSRLLLLVLAVMPGTMTSRVRRGMCRSPAVTCGATATDRSALGLSATLHKLSHCCQPGCFAGPCMFAFCRACTIGVNH